MMSNKTYNRAKMVVSYEVLKQILGLPDDVRIVCVASNFHLLERETFEVMIEHPDLPEVHFGEDLLTVSPTFQEDLTKHGHKLVDWNWKVKE